MLGSANEQQNARNAGRADHSVCQLWADRQPGGQVPPQDAYPDPGGAPPEELCPEVGAAGPLPCSPMPHHARSVLVHLCMFCAAILTQPWQQLLQTAC